MLRYGNAPAPLMSVIPDDKYPAMWRISYRDGSLSPMLNLSRAKDAAAAIAERGPPPKNRQLFRWENADAITPVENAIRRPVERVN